ncbi:MAG: hypothetical protein ABIH23_23265 [bacterium]
MKNRNIFLIVLTCVLGVQSQTIADSIPSERMPEKVYETLRGAVESFPFPEKERETNIKENLAGLEKLKTIGWPVLDEMKWAAFYHPRAETTFFKTWYEPVPEGQLVEEMRSWAEEQEQNPPLLRSSAAKPQLDLPEQYYTLLMPDLTTREMPESSFFKVKTLNYQDDLDELLKAVREGDLIQRRQSIFGVNWVYGLRRPTEDVDFLLLHHAYAAAYFGMASKAEDLIHEVLKQNALFFGSVYDKSENWAFFNAKALPWAESLVQLRSFLAVYKQSRYSPEAIELIKALEQNVRVERALTERDIGDPEELPLDERIDYYIARFPETRGMQPGEPGFCKTVGMGEYTKFSDSVVEIGRPAIPKLIEHLNDIRLTKSFGYRHGRTVTLRVQDVAIACIEKILDIDFYQPSSTLSYLSNETPEIREKVIADVKLWWAEYGDKDLLEGQIARLQVGTVYRRMETLEKIEKINKDAIDSVGILKQWAGSAENNEHLFFVAQELAERGDFSLLPTIREKAREATGYVFGDFLLYLREHGTAEDFRFLRQAVLADINQASLPLCVGRAYDVLKGNIQSTENPLDIPILLDLLRHEVTSRLRTAERPQNGKEGVYLLHDEPIHSDSSYMSALIRLTQHNEGYNSSDTVEERLAAIDRWLAWWKAEGEAAYCRKHPDVLEVLAEPVVDK